MNIGSMISAVQKALGVEVDGRAGAQTWGAIYARLVEPKVEGKEPIEAFATADPRSEKNILTLLAPLQPLARVLIQKAEQNGVRIKVISGLRSYAEQDALYAKGRTTPGPKVTNAPAGYSNHNFGIAFDVGVFEGSKYLAESVKYKVVGALGMDLGLEWGGNWTSIVDQPHFQLRPAWAAGMTEKQMLAELRTRRANGSAVFP